MNSGIEVEGTASPTEGDATSGPFAKLGRLVAALLIGASFVVWIYAFSGRADRPFPDEMDSTRLLIEAIEAGDPDPLEIDDLPAFSIRASKICLIATPKLPNASDANNGVERAEQLRAANGILVELVADLRAQPVATERDAELVKSWLSDWEIYLGDRLRYADEIEADESAVFTLTDLNGGERLERRMTRFARTNLMVPCATPTDVG